MRRECEQRAGKDTAREATVATAIRIARPVRRGLRETRHLMTLALLGDLVLIVSGALSEPPQHTGPRHSHDSPQPRHALHPKKRTQIQESEILVEVPGIEPGSFGVENGLLRAQPAYVLLAQAVLQASRLDGHSCCAISRRTPQPGPPVEPPTDASIRAGGDPGLTDFGSPLLMQQGRSQRDYCWRLFFRSAWLTRSSLPSSARFPSLHDRSRDLSPPMELSPYQCNDARRAVFPITATASRARCPDHVAGPSNPHCPRATRRPDQPRNRRRPVPSGPAPEPPPPGSVRTSPRTAVAQAAAPRTATLSITCGVP
jgi:hypothetical protein